jgi:hypothetical protein
MPDGEIHVVPLSGNPVFPHICANCCAPAQARLPVARVFTSHGEDGVSRSVVCYHPFFCDRCIAAHRAEDKPDPTLFFRRLLQGWFLWIPVLGSGWALSVTIPPLLESLRDGDLHGMAISGCLAAFFTAIALGSAAAIWWRSRHLAVRAPSSITSAIAFTDDLSQTFEPAWRRFTLRNAAYAEQFIQANRRRLWTRSRPESQRAMILRHYGKYALYALLAAAALFAIADELGYPLWDMLRRLGE